MSEQGDQVVEKGVRREATEAKLRGVLAQAISAGKKVSISAIAREAGVTPSLVHTKYPVVAAAIRAHLGVTKRDEVESLRSRLLDQDGANRQLRAEVAQLRGDYAAVASVNASLKHEIAVLKASLEGKVSVISTSASKPRV